ncbi:olfactory receptor 14C36-like [Heterocephalus glaber]|uniref:Olfactory receptor 14C36-like n=1 Tax=Heterocephalus glaber TaxID=10181 RepID=A0AAX6SH01_HETGA|nr:olfactory receptor 14C36-like [Heterocephalus glaber]
MDNLTVFTEFLLMDVAGSQELQILQDLGSISVIVPKAVVNSLMGNKTISLKECASQTFLNILFGELEIAFLVLMSYDHYVAICQSLHYGLIITPSLCSHTTTGSWASGLVFSAIHTGCMFRLPFMKTNVIQQYFCEVPQILRISSSDAQFSEFVLIVVNMPVLLTEPQVLDLTYLEEHTEWSCEKTLMCASCYMHLLFLLEWDK